MAKRERTEKLLKEMEVDDVIETSSSHWASPMVLVKEQDITYRFCVYYRNNVTKKDSYTLPIINHTLGRAF